MFNRSKSIRVRKYATRVMLHNNSEHAVYGLTYVDSSGSLVEEVAETPNSIKYFYTDTSYCTYIDDIHCQYNNNVDVLAVHRKDFT